MSYLVEDPWKCISLLKIDLPWWLGVFKRKERFFFSFFCFGWEIIWGSVGQAAW